MLIKYKTIPVVVGLCLFSAALIYWVVQPRVPDFSEFEAGPERKEAFFTYFLPLIEEENQEIRNSRQDIEKWKKNKGGIGWWDARQIQKLADDCRIKDFDLESDADWLVLLRRVDTVPPSLALVQAANESAWGTSRFSRQGYNYFGQWCFEKGCGIVPGKRATDKNHEVAVFNSPEASVESYMRNLNSHSAYMALRDIRSKLRTAQEPVTGVALAAGLSKYSERGSEYIKELRSMIRDNKLTKYDS